MSGWVIQGAVVPSVPVLGTEDRFPVRRIFCVGQNYADHAREMGSSGRETPVFFDKPADAVTTAPEVPYPPATGNLHHEVELVVALAKGGRNVSSEAAAECVFGYAVGVDLTRRDLQAEAKKGGKPWTAAKGFDHSAPISPICPRERAGAVHQAAISLAVNGLMRQQGNTSEMIWSVAEVIAELSRLFELKAGDLVFTGTPAGVGPLERGDVVGSRIEGVGTLAFTIV
ncbi:MAG: fumarylacetoacetate hydrolase family protein [Xanthomonadales bacterium]|nr:fumarylacetoacetate hydrolase family protein [Gammaproteobacteria bacterium]MBT8055931.1 fumarylacetoacetate hydrolase family protein [Gammaproteobacteria bacterium]NNJ80264.1 fumarylacetoacetate hydrolase family protein [Xanthomonadales bacterium]NNL05819.1 fumarylacetoacetate hydrolase family protein [Xanthomonadales bacterium]